MQRQTAPTYPSDSQTLSHSFVAFSTPSHPYPLFSYSNIAHLTPSYMASLANVLQSPEPSSYDQAQQCPKWVEAMNQELAALEQNHNGHLLLCQRERKI